VFAIEFHDLHKRFEKRSPLRRQTTLKTFLIRGHWLKRRIPRVYLNVLKGVSLQVKKGQTVGIIGRNGSGKSTLLKLLMGIYSPDSGRIIIRGKVSALLELGAGFHPEFSGRENIFINGIILGLTRKEIQQRFDDIVKFAELEEFIDEPVRTYSTGMFMRLGFAIAVHVDPEILLIDEVLAVGDESFVRKCLDKLVEFKRQGKTILIVSHDLESVERWCDYAVWLDGGAIREAGNPRLVIDAYRMAVAEKQNLDLREEVAQQTITKPDNGDKTTADESHEDEPPPVPAEEETEQTMHEAIDQRTVVDRWSDGTVKSRWGSGEVVFIYVRILDDVGRERYVTESGEPLQVEMRYLAYSEIKDPVFGIGIYDLNGTCCYGTNTDIERISLPSINGPGCMVLRFDSMNLVEGRYYLDIAIHSKDGFAYDYRSRFYPLMVRSKIKDVGIFRPSHQWDLDVNGDGAGGKLIEWKTRQFRKMRPGWRRSWSRSGRTFDIGQARRRVGRIGRKLLRRPIS